MYYEPQPAVKFTSGGLMRNAIAVVARLSMVALLCITGARAQSATPFTIASAGEAVAEISASAPGASWDKAGAEASLATLAVDGAYNQDVMLYMGAQPWTYRVFLGPMTAGRHSLTLTRSEK